MTEEHRIAGPALAEPLPAGAVGARVRVPLSGAPGAEWCRHFTGHLVSALTRHPAVGHLRVGQPIRGDQIVLEGVEPMEAEPLGRALVESISAANRAAARSSPIEARLNMEQEEADRIARALAL